MLKTLQSGEEVHPSTGSGVSLIAFCGLQASKICYCREKCNKYYVGLPDTTRFLECKTENVREI
jgi:hypothetical protein